MLPPNFCPDTINGYRARRFLTMDNRQPIIDNGLLWTANGYIVDVGPYPVHKHDFSASVQDLGEQTVAPGLVNAHTHLELSHLHGQTKSGLGFLPWVQSLLELPMKDIQPDMIRALLADLHKLGVVGVGDISGHNPQAMLELHAQFPTLSRMFVEFLGFNPHISRSWPLNTAPKQAFLSAAGHALYSTHPNVLQSVKAWTVQHGRPFSMHLAEHSGEMDLMTTGRGPFADFLRGTLLPSNYRPPGLSPVAYADRLGLLDRETLAVHCVHVDKSDIQTLLQRGTHVCMCPRSNAYIDCTQAPAEALHTAGIPLSLGTDGLCSNQDLNPWQEATYLTRIWQGNLSLTELIAMVTINPARALGLAHIVGTIQPGKLELISRVPDELQAALPL
ncbi:MAG: amidohydrolase family protein [Desulfovermiculus sp.]